MGLYGDMKNIGRDSTAQRVLHVEKFPLLKHS